MRHDSKLLVSAELKPSDCINIFLCKATPLVVFASVVVDQFCRCPMNEQESTGRLV